MAPAASPPLLKLFGIDRNGPGHSLQHIRDQIYSHAWSRVRRDIHKLDFVISETGINRNVPERWISGQGLYGVGGEPLVPPPSCNLHLVNKQISKDFTRYIYNANDLEVDVDLKAVHTDKAHAALNNIATLLRNPNLQKYTQTVRVRIHFPAEYPATHLPEFNQSALDNIAFALDDFHHLGHLAIRIVPGQGAPLDYELRLATFPFYPMRMTNWSIRILNVARFPYTWDLFNAQNIVLLNKAYENYQQTGSLTAPIPSTHIEKQSILPDLGQDHKGLCQSPSTFRQSLNGSQKKRGRKKRAAEAAAAALAASAEAAAEAPEQAASTAAVSNVQTSGPEATITHVIETVAEELSLGSQMNVTHPAEADTIAEEQSLDLETACSQVSDTQRSRSTSAPSPPLSPTYEMEAAHVSGLHPSIGIVISSPTKSSDEKPAVHTAAEDQEGVMVLQNSAPISPACSSVTMVPTNDAPASEHVDAAIDAAGDAIGSTAQLKQAKKKRRNKQGKKNKAKSKVSQLNDLTHDTGAGGTAECEVEMKMVDQEHPETSNDLAVQSEGVLEQPSLSGPNRFDVSQGTWTPFGGTHALFTRAETGISTIHLRNARVDRYLRQQERVLAARAETQDRQKQAKAKQQARKARQALLRREHIAAKSPPSRAMERPRDNIKEDAKSELARNQVEYYNLRDRQRHIEEKIRTLQYERDIKKQRSAQRVVESQDGAEHEIEDQLNSGRPKQDRRFNPDTGIGHDDDSVDSLTQEHPWSTSEEDSGEDLDEAGFVDKVNRKMRRHGLAFRYKQVDPESYLVEPMTFQPTGEMRFSAGNDSRRASETSEKEDAISDLDSPVSPALVPHDPPHNTDNGFSSPVSLRNPSQELPSQRTQYEDSESGQRPVEIPALQMTQYASESDQDPSEVGQPAGQGNSPAPGGGQFATEENQYDRRGDQRRRRSRQGRGQWSSWGNYAPARDSYRGNYRGGRISTSVPRTEQAESPWATAVQAGDGEFATRSVERRLALEHDMQVKGKTYTDYATPIEDSYTKLDEERKPVDKKTEHIVYGPQA